MKALHAHKLETYAVRDGVRFWKGFQAQISKQIHVYSVYLNFETNLCIIRLHGSRCEYGVCCNDLSQVEQGALTYLFCQRKAYVPTCFVWTAFIKQGRQTMTQCKP